VMPEGRWPALERLARKISEWTKLAPQPFSGRTFGDTDGVRGSTSAPYGRWHGFG